jgi:hypothetical protein
MWKAIRFHLSAFIAFIVGLITYLVLFSLSSMMGFPDRVPFAPGWMTDLPFVGNWLLPGFYSGLLAAIAVQVSFWVGKRLGGYDAGWRAGKLFYFLAWGRLLLNLCFIPWILYIKINSPEKWHLFQERWFWLIPLLVFSEAGQEAFREIFEIMGAKAGLTMIQEEDAKTKRDLETAQQAEDEAHPEKEPPG